MLSPKSGNHKDESSAVIVQVESNVNTTNGGPAIGWNINNNGDCPMPNYLSEVHLSHQQITKRFGELLNLFEDYTKILKSENERGSVPLELAVNEARKMGSPVSITRRENQKHKRDSCCVINDENAEPCLTSSQTELSDCTIRPRCSQAATCEASCQTYWNNAVEQKQADMKDLETQLASVAGGERVECEKEKPSKTLQHTIHIEVESVTSATDMRREPLRQRMWNVLTQTTDSIVACTFMIGENFTYVLFVVLCLWCLYLLLGHYYSSLPTNINQQVNLRKDLARLHPK